LAERFARRAAATVRPAATGSTRLASVHVKAAVADQASRTGRTRRGSVGPGTIGLPAPPTRHCHWVTTVTGRQGGAAWST